MSWGIASLIALLVLALLSGLARLLWDLLPGEDDE